MSDKIYTLFVPPDELAQKPAKEWRGSEAEAYFNWMLENLEQRVTGFLQYIDESSEQSCELLLKHVGEKLESILRISTFCTEAADGCRLSNAGYAIAADAGLLVAECLIKKGSGNIHWKILDKPKSAQSFNLPVLVGFSSRIEFDPVAASIAQATGVLRGTNKKDRWLKLYEYWVNQIK